ncbi:MAG: SpoIIE family protein phosphatase [Micrococcales bacterium]|nr:SpoIIE family protein phosphatase [Micrococcales bacterium]
MLALNPELRPIWANAAFASTVGITLEHLQNHPGPFFQHPGIRVPDLLQITSAMSERREASQVMQIRHGDHRWVTMLVTGTPALEGDQIVMWMLRLDDLSATSPVEELTSRLLDRERQDLEVLAGVSQVATYLHGTADLEPTSRLLTGSVVSRAHFLVDLDDHPVSTTPDDPALRVLTGDRDAMADLDLTITHPDGSLSAAVSERLRELWPDETTATLLPVPARHSVVGLLAVVPLAGEGIDWMDETTLRVLRVAARRVGTALESSALYLREHHLAETMQRAMLPHQVEIDDLDVWTYYAPNTTDAQIGGDWYDILPIRPGVAGVVIGDVVGHDVEAAAAMGQLRSVVHAYAFDGTSPDQVLGRVDQVVGGMRVPRAAGVVCSTLTAFDGGWRLDYCRAGHLPPLLRRDQDVTYLTDGQGPMVGFGQHATRVAASVDLRPGDVVVYYTDGLVETRTRSMRDGLDVLADVLRSASGSDASRIGEELLARLARRAEDDIAIVVVRIPDATPTIAASRRRRWSLPHDPSALRMARQAAREACADWNLPGRKSAELVASELVANAVTHGWGEVTLQLADTGDGLRIEVADANPAPPVSTDGHPDRIGGFGIKIVQRLADWGWRHTSDGGKVVWARLHEDPEAWPEPRGTLQASEA